MSETEPKRNLFQKITEIKRRVAYIQKDKEVGSGNWGYKVVTHDAVTALTRSHFIDLGVTILPPSIVKSAAVLTGTTTSKGIPHIRYEATYEFVILDDDNPSDRFSQRVEVHAIDEGDKAPGKAMSYADKYLVLKLLDLESGDDDELRVEQKAPKAIGARGLLQDAYDALEPDMKIWVDDMAAEVALLMKKEGAQQAYEHIEESRIDGENKMALWFKLDAPIRSAIKKHADSLKGK